MLHPRGPVCGQACRARQCTLREIRFAGRLAEKPQIVLWLELLTVAHLVGKPSPDPDPAWLAELRAVERRTLECAVAQRLQVAIDTRYTGLAVHYQPEALASHLANVAMGTVDGTQPCDGGEVEWQAGRFLWIDVLRALRAMPAGAGTHPSSRSWAERGLVLPRTTAQEQLERLQAHPDTWRPAESTITGNRVYETAVDELSHEPAPGERFLAAAEFLCLRTTWPLGALDVPDEQARTTSTIAPPQDPHPASC